MATFSNNELTDIVLTYGESQGNAALAQRMYMERFPNRRIPNVRTFVRVVQRLRDHGSFNATAFDRGRQRPDRVANIKEAVLNSVEARPGCSTRRLALQLEVSHATIWRILKEQQLYPYHVRKVQLLQPENLPRRLQFCEWLLAKLNMQEHFLSNVVTTDEAGFTREGIFNFHNTHIWTDENTYAVRENHFQNKFSINIWAGIINGRIIGPHIMPPRLNAVGSKFLE
jgi:hypothetical protein